MRNGRKNPNHHHHGVLVLPEDLIVHILSELPVKSLLVFKSVCKSWRRMINTPYFIKTHLVRSSTKTKTKTRSESSQFVVVENYMNIVENYMNVGVRLITELYILNSNYPGPAAAVSSSSSSSPIVMNMKLQIIELPYLLMWGCSPHTCHGLITFAANVPTTTSDSLPRNNRIVVMNPATREFHTLPLSIGKVDLSAGSSYVLFDPYSSSYKVLWVSRRNETGDSWHVYVVNLGRVDSSWRKVVVPEDYLKMNGCWVFPNSMNGISYYFPSPLPTDPALQELPTMNKVSLLIFYAEKENFLVFNFLGHVDGFSTDDHIIQCKGFAAFRGSIYAFFICRNSRPKVLDVLVMKDCDQALVMSNKYWMKEKYSCHSPFSDWYCFCWINILAVNNDGIVMRLDGFLKTSRTKLMSICAIYDPIEKVLRKYQLPEQLVLKFGWELGSDPKWADYVESLVSPN